MEEVRLIRLLESYGFIDTSSGVFERPGRREVLHGSLVREEDKGRWGLTLGGAILVVTGEGTVLAKLRPEPLSPADERAMKELVRGVFAEVPGGASRQPPDGPWAV